MNSINRVAVQAAVNGIPVDDVRALIAAVEADPAAGMTRWKVATMWQGQARSMSRVEGFEIGGAPVERRFRVDVDEPLELGGQNHYANPQEYLLSALNACMTVGFTALCALHNIEIQQLDIVTEGDIDLRGFFGLDPAISPGYDRLNTTVTVKGSASAEEFHRIFEMMLATSPNFHNISRPIDVTPKLVVAA
jgi:uncharacterized OsmC-like protein